MYQFVLLLSAAGAGLTGSKMARRVGGVDEFDFKPIGENHNQGVSFYTFHITIFLRQDVPQLNYDQCFCILMYELRTLSYLSCIINYHNTLALGL